MGKILLLLQFESANNNLCLKSIATIILQTDLFYYYGITTLSHGLIVRNGMLTGFPAYEMLLVMF